jgi:hypothetical protein
LQSESAKTNYQAAISSQLSIKKKSIDEEDETFETVYNNLPDDLKYLKDCMHKAQGCCLLLILKLFLKEIYSISERYKYNKYFIYICKYLFFLFDLIAKFKTIHHLILLK